MDYNSVIGCWEEEVYGNHHIFCYCLLQPAVHLLQQVSSLTDLKQDTYSA